MVFVFAAGLIVSILGMAGLLGVKRYELASGHVIFASARPAVSQFFKGTLWWFEKELPALVRRYMLRTVRFCKVVLQRLLARSILWVEHTLERVLHTVREKTANTRTPGEASAFLREVAEHKKNLSQPVRTPHVHEVTVEDVEQIATHKSEFEVE